MLKPVVTEERFKGFLELEPGNRLEGEVEEVKITGLTDGGKERGIIAIRATVAGTKLSLDRQPCVAEIGDLVGLSITTATRVLIGTEGKLCAVTFLGFGKPKQGQKPFHQYQVELDDET